METADVVDPLDIFDGVLRDVEASGAPRLDQCISTLIREQCGYFGFCFKVWCEYS